MRHGNPTYRPMVGLTFSAIAAIGFIAPRLMSIAAPKAGPVTNHAHKTVMLPYGPKPAPAPQKPPTLFMPPTRVLHPAPAPPNAASPPRPANRTVRTYPVTTFPPPLPRLRFAKIPAGDGFTQIVGVFFRKGEAYSLATLDAVQGRRILISSYTVQWQLPKGQSGEIGFAPPSPANPVGRPPAGVVLYADPGQPLKIYGSRTSSDGSGLALVTFTGVETAVPPADNELAHS